MIVKNKHRETDCQKTKRVYNHTHVDFNTYFDLGENIQILLQSDR